MSAFLKTLFGDMRTVAVVIVVLAAEVLLVRISQAGVAGFVVPPLVLAGIAWLARR
jgi:hypothetical protein